MTSPTRRRNYTFRVSIPSSRLAPGRPLVCDTCNRNLLGGGDPIDFVAVVINNVLYEFDCTECALEYYAGKFPLLPAEEVPQAAMMTVMLSLLHTGYRIGLDESLAA